MKRILFETVLVIALAAAGWYAWSQGKLSKTSSGKLGELTEQKAELEGKLDAAETQLAQQAEAIKQWGPKAQQYDAAQGALSGGQVLEDLEKLYLSLIHI